MTLWMNDKSRGGFKGRVKLTSWQYHNGSLEDIILMTGWYSGQDGGVEGRATWWEEFGTGWWKVGGPRYDVSHSVAIKGAISWPLPLSWRSGSARLARLQVVNCEFTFYPPHPHLAMNAPVPYYTSVFLFLSIYEITLRVLLIREQRTLGFHFSNLIHICAYF